MNTENIKKIQDVIEHIRKMRIKKESNTINNGYTSNKDAIARVFKCTKSNVKEDILARLALVDSMYSTQMTKRYFGLEELADAMFVVLKNHETRHTLKSTVLRDLFLGLLNGEIKEKAFDYNRKETIDAANELQGETNLFTEKYGIGKSAKDKGMALSLITKYAYFETKFEFPIFDSIVKEMYPLIWKYCGFDEKCPKAPKDIASFLNTIKILKERLSEGMRKSITFDELDCLLWTTGKILRGNVSLIFSMDQYRKYGEGFDIRKTKFGELKIMFEKDEYLYPFMEFAKELTQEAKAT